MNELVKIRQEVIGDKEVNAIDARALHEFLENKMHFSDWIKSRVKKYDFIEGTDYALHKKMMPKTVGLQGLQQKINYYLSIDMAKQLSMVENNNKGSQARKYFIECENKLKEIPQFTMPKTKIEIVECWLQAEKDKEQLQIEQKKNKPKVDYYEDVSNSTNCTSLNNAAKLLGWGRNNLIKRLRKDHVFMKDNKPYQNYIAQGLFVIKENTWDTGYSTQTNYTTFVTGKGKQWLHKHYNRSKSLFNQE